MDDRDIFSWAFENFPEGLILLDEKDNICLVNKAAEKIRHISKDEKMGKNVLDCHPVHSKDKVLRALRFIKEKERPFTRMVTDQISGNVFENTYQAVFDDSGKTVGSIVISRDITEKRRLEQEKLQYNQTLKNQVEELTEKMNHLFLSSLTSLVNTLEAKDSYTNGHSLRVTHISKTFVEQVFGQIPLLLDIELAAKLHDIGKIGIRENILNKPEKLTEEEYAQMKLHPVIMETILSPFTHLKEVIHIAKHHHERFDGKGYPDQLKGESIPFGSRILALADTYDAMTSSRPYRKALEPEMAVTEIKKNLGTQFDPEIGVKFAELVESGTL